MQKPCLTIAYEHLKHPDVTHLKGIIDTGLRSFGWFNYPKRMPGQTTWCF